MRPQEQPTVAEEKPEQKKKDRASKKAVAELLKQKILDNLDYFLEDEQKIFNKLYRGPKSSLTSAEQSIMHRAINRFWEAKYKKKYTGGAKDRKILFGYDPAEKEFRRKAKKEKEIAPEQTKIVGPWEMKAAKKQTYLEKYAEQTEGVEALAGMTSFFEEEKLAKFEKRPEERKKLFQSLTEYQYLLTHFLIANNQDEEMLSLFWEAMESRAGIDYARRFEGLRYGVLTQVAIYRVFEKLGIRPKLSHPAEDAFNAIDMWVMKDAAVQVKGDSVSHSPIIVNAQEINFPGVEISSLNSKRHYNNGYGMFRAKLNAYRRKTGKDVAAFYVVLSHKSFNPITGEPSKNAVEFFKQKLRKIKMSKRFVE